MKQQNPNFAFSTALVQKWTERPSLPESLEVKMVKEELGREDCADSQCLGLQIIGQLFKATSTNSFEDFKRQFVFGVEMRMWRKGRVKDVVAFTDQNIPNLLWIATRSKAFLFDLCYCSLAGTDVELQLSEHVTHYFVLSYFEEKIPFLFQDLPTLKRFITLFRSAIFQYQQLNPVYPPYLSKLTKHYTVVETVDSGKRASSPAEILKIAERLVGPDKRTIYEDILRQVVGEQRESSGNGLEDAALEVEEVMRFFKIACCNENLKAIYQYYAQSALSRKADYILPLMSVQNLKLFLKREQGESEQAASSIAAKHFSGAVSFYEFCTFLSSKQLNYLALAPPLDEHLPLNHYFCYSSHNTYLSGNQLTSDSKVERYLQDLANGLKCLEIDVHESGQELIVTHALNGLHLNKEVSFEEVIREIGSYCSRTADFYPIILSIENRTSKKSSYRLAAIFEKYLGPFLLTLHHQFKHEITTVCHTLAQLKNKVIIKADARMKDILAFSKKEQHSPKKEQQPLPLTIPLRPQPSYLSKQFTLKYQRFQGHVSLFQARRKAFQSEFMASYYQPLDEIAKVTALFKSEQGINNHNSVGYESTSITSKKLEKLQAKVAVEYTRRSFLRVYPAGTEIGSSNFSPIPGLQRGAQLIALNTQTKDDFAWLMMSYFCAGTRDSQERMGYIPKPLHLINDQPQKTTTKNISISILSTLFPTKIRFFGSEEDMNQNKDNSLSFEVKDVQVGFFMFQMENGLRDCIPLRFIREGYRVIVGRNKDYVDCGVPVLLRVKIKNVSSEILSLRLH